MDLLKKITALKNKIDDFERIVDDLNDNLLGKKKKIDFLKEQINQNIKKIDKIIKDYNANS